MTIAWRFGERELVLIAFYRKIILVRKLENNTQVGVGCFDILNRLFFALQFCI